MADAGVREGGVAAHAPPDRDGNGCERHLRLVHSVMRRSGFAHPRVRGSLAEDDLVQVGMMGVVRAARTWDPSQGSWTTYAWQWIWQRMSREIQNASVAVRTPVHEQEARAKRGERRRASMTSTDAPVRAGNDDVGATLGEMMPDTAAADAVSAAEDRAHAATVVGRLMAGAGLTPRERRVLELRSADVMLRPIGVELGISHERVRQIEVKALAKLRRAAARAGIRGSAA